MNEFTSRVIHTIKNIPYGMVSTYGDIATYCGNNRAARRVSNILSSMSEKHSLPWHRVINSKGTISLTGNIGQMQKELLQSEGVVVNNKTIDLNKYRCNLNET